MVDVVPGRLIRFCNATYRHKLTATDEGRIVGPCSIACSDDQCDDPHYIDLAQAARDAERRQQAALEAESRLRRVQERQLEDQRLAQALQESARQYQVDTERQEALLAESERRAQEEQRLAAQRKEEAEVAERRAMAERQAMEQRRVEVEEAERRMQQQMQELRQQKQQLEEQQQAASRLLPLQRVQHIEWSELQLGREVVGGAFKTVHRARWRNSDVAVLRLRSGDIATEAAVFERLGRHRHLTRLLGMSRDPSGAQVLVTEFASRGSLFSVLEDLADGGQQLSVAALVRIAIQVCEGMIQIAEEGMMHRDLAARNVLAFVLDPGDPSSILVKITDNGLAKDASTYYYASGDVLPMRWMPPEAIERRRFSEKSDVWAFGVLLWELWSDVKIPYGVIGDDSEVARRVVAGERLARPDGCPAAAYTIMQRCWAARPQDRPTFAELQQLLLDLHAQVQGSQEEVKTCVICLDGAATMAVLPCGHRCLCSTCAVIVRECLVCRSPVQRVQQIFDAPDQWGV